MLFAIDSESLGAGHYGVVYKGTVKGLSGRAGSTVVAIKTALPSPSRDVKAEFWEEMRVMAKAGKHLNIVNLLGAVWKGE